MATIDAGPVAGQVMGPRPGIAIVSFMQGIVEIGLRAGAIALGVILIICAAAALGNVDDLTSDEQDFINDDRDNDYDPFDLFADTPNTPNLVDNTAAAAGWIIFLSLAAVGYEVLWILVRFLNIGLVNLQIIIFLVVDIVVSGLFVLGYKLCWCNLCSLWGDWGDYGDDFGAGDDFQDAVEGVRNSLSAAAFFAFIAMGVFGGIAVWMILFLIMKWNENESTPLRMPQHAENTPPSKHCGCLEKVETASSLNSNF